MFENQFRGVVLIGLGLSATLVGVVFSPVLISLGLIVLCAGLVLDFRPLGFTYDWRKGLPRILRTGLFWGLTGLYLWLLLTFWQTYDWDYYLDRLRIKVPLLLLPLAWAGVAFDRGGGGELSRAIVYVFAGFIAVVLAGVLVNYALHFEKVNALIYVGKAVPVPRGNHVRFSLLAALAATAALHGFLSWRRWPMLALAAFLFVGLHLLAVRTGLVLLYAGWGVLLLFSFGRGRGSGVGGKVIALLGLLTFPVIAYLTIPSLRTKLNYARYELFHRSPGQDDGGTYSDEGRLRSIQLGLEVWRAHPALGVGPGNLEAAMDGIYAHRAPGAEPLRPHNQFVSALAGGGLFGGIVTVGCFLVIGFGGGRWRRPLFLAFWVMLSLSCLVENTLETSVGVTIFTLTLLLTGYPPVRKPG